MKAVIFDMDGVIVDSEPLWQQAEREVFSDLGVKVTDELCQITQSMTTTEVARFWYKQSPWSDTPVSEAESQVVDRVIELIQKHDCVIPDITRVVGELTSRGFRLGLATNSPYRIIPEVLARADLASAFEVISSSEFEKAGKPEPDVYLSTLKKLAVPPQKCLAIEDSNSGIVAAKKAGIKAIAFCNNGRNPIREAVSLQIQAFAHVDYTALEALTA